MQLTHAGHFSDRDLAKDPSKHEQMSAQSIFNPVKFNSVDKCQQMIWQRWLMILQLLQALLSRRDLTA
jgi:hypothetical protein